MIVGASVQDKAADVAKAVAQAAPPVTVWALNLDDWLKIFSIAYIVLQAAFLVWRWTRARPRGGQNVAS